MTAWDDHVTGKGPSIVCNGDELDQLRSDVRYLMDRSAILDCISEHSRGHDRHDADLLTKAYHPDGVDEHGNAVNSGPTYAAWINPVHAAGSQVHTRDPPLTYAKSTAIKPIARATCWCAFSTTMASPLA